MIRKISFMSAAFTLLSFFCFAQARVINLKTENLINPIGLDVATPRFSWQLQSDKRNVAQTAYEIRVSKGVLAGDKNILWSSGKVNSDQSLYVPYKGEAVTSGQKYSWQVRVWDNTGKASEWSAPASWQMGLLQTAD